MELTGTIISVSETRQVSDKFKVRNFVIETDSPDQKYNQKIEFQLANEKTDLLKALDEGSHAKIVFDIRGREWKNPQGETKYFNTLQAYKVEIQ